MKTLDELYESLDRVWERVGYRNVEEEFIFYDKARVILKTYFEEIALKWEGSVEAVEKQFFLDLPAIGVKLQGILDRVDKMPDGSWALVEYKSQGEAWAQERLATDLQMTLYNKAAQEALGLVKIRLYFFFLSQGKYLEVTRSSGDWVVAERVLKDVRQGVEKADFTPNTNYCAFCDMNKTCQYAEGDKGEKSD